MLQIETNDFVCEKKIQDKIEGIDHIHFVIPDESFESTGL